MKQKKSFVLDEKDAKAAQLLEGLGMPKNLAKTLLYTYQVEECRSADVEQGADLRQPEVSVAMQELRRRGWIQKLEVKKEGKGRPVHIYKQSMQLSEIMNDFEQEKIKEIEGVKKIILELKNTISNI